MNLSDTHRKILTAVWVLQQEQERDASFLDDHKYDQAVLKPFAQRKIAEASGVPQSTVSDNKSFLAQSVEFAGGIPRRGPAARRRGQGPSWWARGDALVGFPTPEQVWRWWHGEDSDDPGGGGGGGGDGEGNSMTYLLRGD